MAPKEEPNQAEAVRPQGYRVGSVLTSRDPAHPYSGGPALSAEVLAVHTT